ncbi:hypothetical protein DFJ74DRAFT_252558 [Hyaloraphidium curvatum]|nr:hypothetical protein DFJ74DRAFT_252558 [Hyaloraphidium curvatum]
MGKTSTWTEDDIDFAYFLGFVGIASAAAVIYGRGAFRKGFSRYPTHEHLTQDTVKKMAAKKRPLYGVAVRVGDADGLRLYHVPAFRRRPRSLDKVDLKGGTINVRLAGVDAPEGAAFGATEQPFYKEARRFLEKAVVGKDVEVQPLSKDQYGRIVGMVSTRDWTGFRRRNINLEMVQQGLAVVYKQGGAQYGSLEKQLLAAEEAAKVAKRGIWSQSKIVLPGEHKAKLRAAAAGQEHKEDLTPAPGSGGIVSRLWAAVFGKR